MKKFIVLLLTVFSSLHLAAAHLTGGEIYWECQGNGDYIFTIKLYRDCNGTVLSNSVVLNSNTPIGNIPASLVATQDITWGCAIPAQSISCSSVAGTWGYTGGSQQELTYRSAPVTIGSTAPPSGYQFWFETFGRSTGIENIPNPSTLMYYFSATMYPEATGGCIASSPRFLSDVQPVISGEGTMSFIAGTGSAKDSLYYSLVSPKISATQFISWKSGYSATSPLPDQSENSSNGPVIFDNERGLLGYKITSAIEANYALAVQVDSWRNGEIYSSVVRDIMVYYTSLAPANSPPVAAIDTTIHTNVTRLSDSHYEIQTMVGDTIDLDLEAVDANIHPNGNLQNIKFRAYGEPLDTIFNQSSPLFASAASVTPLAPQTGFVNAMQNQINFKWGITSDMLVSDKPEYYFTFEFRDDRCPYPKVSYISLKVNVVNPVEINRDSVSICEGNSVQLSGSTASGNYVWLPNSDISDNTIANPVVSPSSSMYYYLTDPQNGGVQDSVYVQVEPLGSLQLTSQSGVLEIGGTANLGLFMWYYNGMPFYHPHDTLTPFAPGQYWVKGITTICVYTSDTVVVLNNGNISTLDPTNGNVVDSLVQLTGSLGLDFTLDSSAAGDLQNVYLLGVSTGTFKMQAGDITIKIYETNSQTEVFSNSLTINNPNGEIIVVPANVTLEPGVGYTLALTGDSTVFIQTLENISYPFEPNNDGIEITAAKQGGALQFPAASSNQHLAMVLQIHNNISLTESYTMVQQVYPIPADEELWIEGMAVNSKLVVVDINGKILEIPCKDHGDKAMLDISRLAPGTYILNIITTNGSQSVKFSVK